MKKFKRLQALLLSAILIFSLAFSACGGDTSESSVESVNSSVESSMDSSGETSQEDDLSEADKNFLQYYREPDMKYDFEDNLINVYLKSKYSTMESIGFSDFPFASIDQVYSISYDRDTIYANENKRLTLRERTHQTVVFELYTHSKENVLKLIEEINDLEIVLAAGPEYNDLAVDDWVAFSACGGATSDSSVESVNSSVESSEESSTDSSE